MYFNVDHRERSGCYYNDGIAGGSDFSDDIFEDCHFTDGHQEDNCFDDGHGVYDILGADLEVPTTAGKRSGPSSGSRPATTTIKPEETPRQVKKGTTIY